MIQHHTFIFNVMKFTETSATPGIFLAASSIRLAQFAQSTSILYVFFMLFSPFTPMLSCKNRTAKPPALAIQFQLRKKQRYGNTATPKYYAITIKHLLNCYIKSIIPVMQSVNKLIEKYFHFVNCKKRS